MSMPSALLQDSDIDETVSDLKGALRMARSPCTDFISRAEQLSQSLEFQVPQIVSLLEELRLWRRAGHKHSGDGTQNVTRAIVEGYSETDSAEALAKALEKAAGYFSEQHDIAITVKGLINLPEGGHRATVEVMMTPLHLRLNPKIKGLDIELKRIHDHGYYNDRKKEDGNIRHLVFDHFSACKGASPVSLPEYFMININDSVLLNHMLEKQFLNARDFHPQPSFSGVHHVLVRTREPEPRLIPGK